ncbi:MAG: sigma-70 family RNA polymerase sigma factor, partial [Candidatus Poribacteria bacterium]|nr:sigma-70 family RNA polymerase sigma factor [Candidatus Poribacteria bacterium]
MSQKPETLAIAKFRKALIETHPDVFFHKLPDGGTYRGGTFVGNAQPFDAFAFLNGTAYVWEFKFHRGAGNFHLSKFTEDQRENLTKAANNGATAEGIVAWQPKERAATVFVHIPLAEIVAGGGVTLSDRAIDPMFHPPPGLSARKRVDIDLITRFQSGDRSAFNGIVRRYRAMVHSIILSGVKRAEDAEDLTQEVMIRLYHSLSKFRTAPPFSLNRWLTTTARRIAIDHHRRTTRHLSDVPLDAPLYET